MRQRSSRLLRDGQRPVLRRTRIARRPERRLRAGPALRHYKTLPTVISAAPHLRHIGGQQIRGGGDIHEARSHPRQVKPDQAARNEGLVSAIYRELEGPSQRACATPAYGLATGHPHPHRRRARRRPGPARHARMLPTLPRRDRRALRGTAHRAGLTRGRLVPAVRVLLVSPSIGRRCGTVAGQTSRRPAFVTEGTAGATYSCPRLRLREEDIGAAVCPASQCPPACRCHLWTMPTPHPRSVNL